MKVVTAELALPVSNPVSAAAKQSREPCDLRAYATRPADPPPPCSTSWQVSDGCWALLLRMLAADPAARPSLARIAEHSWVRVGAPQELLRLNDLLLSKACSELPPSRRLSSCVSARIGARVRARVREGVMSSAVHVRAWGLGTLVGPNLQCRPSVQAEQVVLQAATTWTILVDLRRQPRLIAATTGLLTTGRCRPTAPFRRAHGQSVDMFVGPAT